MLAKGKAPHPSTLSQIMQCPASLRLQAESPPRLDSSYADEGIAIHDAGHQMLSSVVSVGQTMPNGVVLTDDMLEVAREFYNHVFRVTNDRDIVHWASEEWLDLSHLLPGMRGRPDYYCLDHEGICDLIELKSGHRQVRAFENWQNLAYATAIPAELYRIHVVQPRCYSGDGIVDTWTVSGEEVRRNYLPRMQAACLASQDERAPAVTGDACRDCAASGECPAAIYATGWLSDRVRAPLLVEMTADSVGLELSILEHTQEILKGRIATLEAVAMGMIGRGANVPGWAVTHGQGREKWTVPVEAIAQMGEMLGLDVMRPLEAKTPPQVRKLLKKGMPVEFIDRLVTRNAGEKKLVPANTETARRVFARLGTT
jgi:hypothetical protein